MFTPIGIVAFVVLLGILIFVHEFGHFCVAKWAGVKVLKFSLGFGPKLISRQWGETEYMICAFPLGGYVLMLGEGNGEQGEGAELTPEEKERSFAAKSVWQRAAIVVAGPLMNLALPFLVLPLVYLVGAELPAYLDRTAQIGYVVAGSEAERAGFVAGDQVLTINGDAVATWEAANMILVSHAGMPLTVVVARAGAKVPLSFRPGNDGLEGLMAMGLFPREEARVHAVSPGMPAEKAGIVAGDLLRSIDGTPIGTWYGFRAQIQAGGETSHTLLLERNGQERSVQLLPVENKAIGTGYFVGIEFKPDTVVKRFGPLQALREGANKTVELVRLTVVFVQKFLTFQVSAKNIGGPIQIAEAASRAVEMDLATVLSLLAFLSIQLGILNLLPIPVLDGGHLFFYAMEVVARRPLSVKAREIAQQIGLVLLIMLMVLAFYNDIVRLFFRASGG